MQNTCSACKYVDLLWHWYNASFQGQNLAVKFKDVLGITKKKKAKAKQITLEEPEQMDRMCQGRTKGLLKNQEADVSPCCLGQLSRCFGAGALCECPFSTASHSLLRKVWALRHAPRYFRGGVWRAAHVWSSHCPAGALLDLQGFGGRWHGNVLRKMFYYYCFCQLNFGELY